MSNSSLATIVKLSPNATVPRNKPIKRITPHHVAGILTAEGIANCFQSPSRQASANYGVGSDAKISLIIEEKNRPWTSSSAANDNEAVTMEISNSVIGGNWDISAASYNAFIELCVDICRRNPDIRQKNGQAGLYYDGTPSASLTFHYFFAATSCPGEWIKQHAQDICNKVNAKLAGGAVPVAPPPVTAPSQVAPAAPNTTGVNYIVKVRADELNIRQKPTTDAAIVGVIRDMGAYTIVEESAGKGATKWGRLRSGAGWISLDYCQNTSTTAQAPSTTPVAAPAGFSPDVGAIVEFTGNTHYENAVNGKGHAVKPGRAKITSKYNAAHPYHLVGAQGGAGAANSNVYGWVDAKDIKAVSAPTPTPPPPPAPAPAPKPSVNNPFVNGRTYTITASALKVRTGPGTNYAQKSRAQLTPNGQSVANADGTLPKGVAVTCNRTQIVGNEVWIEIPSGWVAGIYNGEVYVK